MKIWHKRWLWYYCVIVPLSLLYELSGHKWYKLGNYRRDWFTSKSGPFKL